jgi:hypothetical protein
MFAQDVLCSETYLFEVRALYVTLIVLCDR